MQVPFHVPLEVNIVLIGINGDGGHRFSIDSQKLEEFLKLGFPTHRPSCLETGEILDIEHHIVYDAFPTGQPELTALEKALKLAMIPAGTAREADFGREVPLFEVDITKVEPEFRNLYSLFDVENERDSTEEMDRPLPSAIFIVNFNKARMDPRNNKLTEEELKKEEGDYIYHYRYNGGGAHLKFGLVLEGKYA